MIKKLIAIGMLSGLWLAASPALAITPGNLDLDNVATLTYAGNTTGIQAQASVRVNVIASIPDLTTVSDLTKAENQTVTTEAQYTVTATNNGFDTYTFEPASPTEGDGLTDTSTGGAQTLILPTSLGFIVMKTATSLRKSSLVLRLWTRCLQPERPLLYHLTERLTQRSTAWLRAILSRLPVVFTPSQVPLPIPVLDL